MKYRIVRYARRYLVEYQKREIDKWKLLATAETEDMADTIVQAEMRYHLSPEIVKEYVV